MILYQVRAHFFLKKLLTFLICVTFFLATTLVSVHANSVGKQTLQRGDYITYELRFVFLRFTNGTMMEPVDFTGTTNGTLSIYVEDVISSSQVVLRLTMDIPDCYHVEEEIIFDTESQQIYSYDQSYVGFFTLWFNTENINQMFAISQNALTNQQAFATYNRTTTIDTHSQYDTQEVYMLTTKIALNAKICSWRCFYDKDTLLLLSMVGDVADPVLLGLFGIDSIDFALSITDTSLPIGESPKDSPWLILFSPIIWIIVFFAILFVILSVVIYKKQQQGRRRRRR